MTSFSIIWSISVAIIFVMATHYAKWIKKLWTLNNAVKAQNKEISIADAIDQEKFHNSILYIMLTFVQNQSEFIPDSIQFIGKYIFEAIPENYQEKAIELLDYYTQDAAQTSRISVLRSLTDRKVSVYSHLTDKTSYSHHVNEGYSKNLNDVLSYTGKLYVVYLIARLLYISSQRTNNYITIDTLRRFFKLAQKDLHISIADSKSLWDACTEVWNILNTKQSATDLGNWYATNITAKNAKYPPYGTLGNIHRIEILGLTNQELDIDISQKNKELNKKLNYLFMAALLFCSLSILITNINIGFDALNSAGIFCFIGAAIILAYQKADVHSPYKFIRGTQNTEKENTQCLIKTISGAFILILTFILDSNVLFQLANHEFASHYTFERYIYFKNKHDENASYSDEMYYYAKIPFRIDAISPNDLPPRELSPFDKYATTFLGISCFYREQGHQPIVTVYGRKKDYENTHRKNSSSVNKNKIYVTKGFYNHFSGIVEYY